jgi:anti-anti-sigma factor
MWSPLYLKITSKVTTSYNDHFIFRAEGDCLVEIISGAVRSHCVGTTAVIYASDYLNKLTGEKIERECRRQLDSGCRALVIDFSDTKLVNSIGISILLGIINVAEKNGARIVFSDVNNQTIQLFEMLGLTRHVVLAKNEQEALSNLSGFDAKTVAH